MHLVPSSTLPLARLFSSIPQHLSSKRHPHHPNPSPHSAQDSTPLQQNSNRVLLLDQARDLHRHRHREERRHLHLSQNIVETPKLLHTSRPRIVRVQDPSSTANTAHLLTPNHRKMSLRIESRHSCNERLIKANTHPMIAFQGTDS